MSNDGRYLIRQTAYASELELIDLTNLEPIARIRPVPVENRLGWIATTSDGFWDSSAGAEKYVEVFDGLRRLTEAEKLQRKVENLLQSRLSFVK